jgi:hypothetical protein
LAPAWEVAIELEAETEAVEEERLQVEREKQQLASMPEGREKEALKQQLKKDEALLTAHEQHLHETEVRFEISEERLEEAQADLERARHGVKGLELKDADALMVEVEYHSQPNTTWYNCQAAVAMREEAEVTSNPAGQIPKGTRIQVLGLMEIEGLKVRAHVQGGTHHPEGWVSVKFLNCEQKACGFCKHCKHGVVPSKKAQKRAEQERVR